MLRNYFLSTRFYPRVDRRTRHSRFRHCCGRTTHVGRVAKTSFSALGDGRRVYTTKHIRNRQASVVRIDDSARRNYSKCFTRRAKTSPELVPGGVARGGGSEGCGWRRERERDCCVIFQKQKTNTHRRHNGTGVVAVSIRCTRNVLRWRGRKRNGENYRENTSKPFIRWTLVGFRKIIITHPRTFDYRVLSRNQ